MPENGSASDDRPPWTPGMAIRRKQAELAAAGAAEAARQRARLDAFHAAREAERRASVERSEIPGPRCPWCGRRRPPSRPTCSSCADLERLFHSANR